MNAYTLQPDSPKGGGGGQAVNLVSIQVRPLGEDRPWRRRMTALDRIVAHDYNCGNLKFNGALR